MTRWRKGVVQEVTKGASAAKEIDREEGGIGGGGRGGGGGEGDG